jgi:deoxyribonuclease (pyrimidine dimer)
MTRINLVPVENLADQHLFAEWREIKMVPAALRRSLRTKSIQVIQNSIPGKYTLNTGHVTFFYNKMKFLTERYRLLTGELVKREYNINSDPDFRYFFGDLPKEFNHVDWHPDKKEVDINIERISARISEKPEWYRYYGRRVIEGYFDNMYKVL